MYAHSREATREPWGIWDKRNVPAPAPLYKLNRVHYSVALPQAYAPAVVPQLLYEYYSS